jgi:hypothetical protein
MEVQLAMKKKRRVQEVDAIPHRRTYARISRAQITSTLGLATPQKL